MMEKQELTGNINARKAKPGNPEYEETRQFMVDQAIELIAEKGFEKLRFDQLANRIGRNRTTIYRYFDSKRELVTAVMKTLMMEITENIIEDTAGTRETTPEKFTDNLYKIINALQNEDRYRIIMDAQNIEQFAELCNTHFSEIASSMLSKFMVDAEIGRILRRDIELDEAVHWLIHQIITYGFLGLKGDTEAEQKQYLDRMVSPVLFN